MFDTLMLDLIVVAATAARHDIFFLHKADCAYGHDPGFTDHTMNVLDAIESLYTAVYPEHF